MGGIDPATIALAALQTGISSVRQNAADKQARRATEAEYQARANEIAIAQDAEARDRNERMRRALARQRAMFGGSGVTSSGGSANALLSGLVSETEAQDQESRRLYDQRLNRLSGSAPRATSGFNFGQFASSLLSSAFKGGGSGGSLLEQ